MDGFTFSKHAIERALDMAVDPAVIRECLLRPEVIKKSTRYPQCDLYMLRDITCSVARDCNLVATIMWRTDEAWRKDLIDGPAFEGRSYRGVTA